MQSVVVLTANGRQFRTRDFQTAAFVVYLNAAWRECLDAAGGTRSRPDFPCFQTGPARPRSSTISPAWCAPPAQGRKPSGIAAASATNARGRRRADGNSRGGTMNAHSHLPESLRLPCRFERVQRWSGKSRILRIIPLLLVMAIAGRAEPVRILPSNPHFFLYKGKPRADHFRPSLRSGHRQGL